MSEKLKKLEEKGLQVEQTTVKKKRKLKGVPGTVKAKVCDRLGIYLKVINFMGDDYMSQRQFVQFCYELELVEKDDRDSKITKIINDLVRADLVKKTRIGATNAKMLLLTKYAKRWLVGAATSQEVSATKAYKSDKPFLKSIIKMDYFLKFILPSCKKIGVKDLDGIKKVMSNSKNSLLVKRKGSGDYYGKLYNTEVFKSDLNASELQEIWMWCYYRLAVDKQRLKHDLSEVESKAIAYDKKTVKTSVWTSLKYNLKEDVASKRLSPVEREAVYTRTLYELINRDVVIGSISKKDDVYLINFEVFDAYNNADVNKIECSIAATVKMFQTIFKQGTKINFNCTIHVFNDNMKDRVKRGIERRLEKEHEDREKALKYRYLANVKISYYSVNLHENYLLSED